MPFRFRYATLLRQRELEEQRRQRDLAELTNLRTAYLQRLRDMQASISQARAQLGDGLRGSVDVQQVNRFARYAIHRRGEGQRLVLRLSELEKHVEAGRQQLVEATQRRRALELLRDREHEAWRKERRRREAIEMDEIANQRAARRALAATHAPRGRAPEPDTNPPHTEARAEAEAHASKPRPAQT